MASDTGDVTVVTRSVDIVGCWSASAVVFHKLRLLLQQVASSRDHLTVNVEYMLPIDYDAYLTATKRKIGGAIYAHQESPLVLVDGAYIGDAAAVERWVQDEYGVRDPRMLALHQALTKTHYQKYLQSTGHSYAYLDVRVGTDGELSRITFELYDDICPKACQHFRSLCAGDIDGDDGTPISYVGSLFHRVVADGWLQGGDVTPGSPGDGTVSLYGEPFEDESYAVEHDKPGVLGLCNEGPHTNASQFYITLKPMPVLDRRFAAFGRAIEGLDTLRLIASVECMNQRPLDDVVVADAGVIALDPLPQA